MRKFISVLLLLLSCSIVRAQDSFHSKFWGFSIARPEHWLELDTNYVHKNINEYDFTEEQLDKIFEAQQRAIPLLALSKRDPLSNAGVIPTIKINASPIRITDQDAFLKAIQSSFNSVLKVLDNGRQEQESRIIRIKDIPVIFLVISYDLKKEGNVYRARTFSYSVLRKGYFVQFNLSDTGDSEDCSKLFGALASSITFDKN